MVGLIEGGRGGVIEAEKNRVVGNDPCGWDKLQI